jgi:parallel beta-helix repeat protein
MTARAQETARHVQRWAVATVVAAVVLSLAFGSGARAAPARTIACGQIVTVDTKLMNDLVDCPGNGILIGAHGVTLDLNGHTVDGDGVPVESCPADEPCDVGVVNTAIRDGRPFNGPGHHGVTIKNGTVRQFAEIGIYVLGVTNNRVRRVVAVDNAQEGIGIHRSARSSVEQSAAIRNGLVGIVVDISREVRVTQNAVSANGGDVFTAGIFVAESEHTSVVGNAVSDHQDGDGIMLTFGAHDNVVRDNAMFRNGGGLAINDSNRNLITRNVIRDNLFIGAYTNGGDDNRFDRNHIARNGDGSAGGIELDTSGDVGGTSDRNVLSGNVLAGNVGDGIRVDPGQKNTVIVGNVATGNTDDGIDVDSALTRLTRNMANANGDLGIEAVAGVTDGGGNRARTNGNPVQCTNVACR